MITSLGFSQNNVTVSGTAAWTGYANVFALDGTTYQFGSGWALADIKTVVTPATNTLTLYPNFNAYTNALNGDDNDIAYWTNGAGLGNKIFEGNSFIENSALAGQILTFTGNVTSNTLASGYTAVAFIKGLNPATGYSADVNLSVPLVSGQPFSVTTTTAIPAGLIVQYGFTVKGLNGNPANEAALGKVVVTATAASNPIEPLTAAPTPPVRNASDVVSIYSNAYANVTLDELPTSWSQTTFSTLQIQGNDTWKSIGEFLGMVTNYANGVDLSTMEKMHIDYWTTDNNPIGVKIVNTVNGGEALASLGTTATGSWQSIDIDMSAFAALPNKTKITQLLIDPTGSSTIYIDNFYFWKAPAAAGTPIITGFSVPAKFLGDPAFTLTAPTSNSPGVFSYSSSNLGVATISGNTVTIVGLGTTTITATQAATGSFLSGSITADFVVSSPPPAVAAPTPPARNASDVVSIYSNAYANVTLDELPTGWSQTTFSTLQIQGNDTWKSVGEFLGMVTNYANGVDLSTMEKMHIDYWTPDNNPIGVKIVNTVNGGEALASLGTTVTGSWQSIDVDMSAFASLTDKTKITQLLIDPTGPSTVYIDNFYFWKAPLAVTTFDTPKVSLYPNPTTGLVTIVAGSTIETMSVFNVLGQEMLTQKGTSALETLNISNLQSGIYIVKTTINGKTASSRIIKK